MIAIICFFIATLEHPELKIKSCLKPIESS